MAQEQFAYTSRNDGRLFHAVNRGDQTTVISELAQGDIDLSLKIGGKSLLRLAGERGHKNIASILLERGANPNEVNGKRRHSLLHSAAATRNYGFASVLLEHQANPSARTSNHATPLHFAARTGQEYLARLLLKFKSEVNAQDTQGRTPLYLALKKGNTSLAKIFVQANGDLTISDRRGVSPKQVAESLGLKLSSFHFHL